MSENNQDKVELTHLLANLRHELAEARQQAKQDLSDIYFDLKDIEIELQTVISTQHSAQGGVKAKWFVLSVEAAGKAQYAHASTQTLRLKLSPVAKTPPEGENSSQPSSDDDEFLISKPKP